MPRGKAAGLQVDILARFPYNYTMVRGLTKGTLLGILLISLFLLEYMEPSAIGVRAHFDWPQAPENADGENNTIPHAMGFNSNNPFETRTIINLFLPLSRSASLPSVYFPIERPPLSRA